jgi:alpha-tubulin suppressor-like RCC1 family protein
MLRNLEDLVRSGRVGAVLAVAAIGIVGACVGDNEVASTSNGDGGGAADVSTADGTGPAPLDASDDSRDAVSSGGDACEMCGGTSCVDLSKDAKNCGQCAHSCSGTNTCVSAHCSNEIEDVSTGSNSVCVLRWGGSVYCWGQNQYGAVGDGTITGSPCSSGGNDYACHSTPTSVVGLSGVANVSVGLFHACAVKTDGTLWCWGRNQTFQLGHSAGDMTCSIPGSASTTPCNPTPTQVTFPAGVLIARVAAGSSSTCALAKTSGDVYCWGANGQGQLGQPPSAATAVPAKVPGLPGPAREVKLNMDHRPVGCALLADTTVWCWGDDAGGALGRDGGTDMDASGNPYGAPQAVMVGASALSGVATVQVGGGDVCVLKTDGTVWCWGANDYGVVGNGTSNANSVPQQVASGLPTVVTALSMRDFNALALDATGNVYSWGRANIGAIGDGTLNGDAQCGATCKATPIKLPTIANVSQIAAGEGSSTLVKADGTVWAWGGNDGTGALGHVQGTDGDGMCGAGATGVCNPTPLQVPGLP